MTDWGIHVAAWIALGVIARVAVRGLTRPTVGWGWQRVSLAWGVILALALAALIKDIFTVVVNALK